MSCMFVCMCVYVLCVCIVYPHVVFTVMIKCNDWLITLFTYLFTYCLHMFSFFSIHISVYIFKPSSGSTVFTSPNEFKAQQCMRCMNESRSPFSQFKLWAHVKFHVATVYRNYLDTLPSSILLLSSGLATYKLGSITFGIGLISVPSSCSIRCKLKRSSYVIRLIAIPKWPNLPDRPIRCRYVSAIFGKSKLITTFTAWTSIPRVNRSLLTWTQKESFTQLRIKYRSQ